MSEVESLQEKESRRMKYLDMDLVAHKAAKEAAKEVFAQLGGNINDPAQVEEFRKDLRFGGQLRRAADKSFMAFVLTGFFVLAAATWYGVAGKINGD